MLDNKEIWKDVKGYEGLYQISNMGRVWSVRKQNYLRPYEANGYLKVSLIAKNGKLKREYVHRLVALAFIDNPDNLPVVNHKDGNKNNNDVNNLEWVTRSYNAYHSYHILNNKGCCKEKPVLCVELDKIFKSGKEATEFLGMKSSSSISECCNNKNGHKTVGGYHWSWAYGEHTA